MTDDQRALARIIRKQRLDGALVDPYVRVIADALADRFQATNTDFDRDGFLLQCGLSASHSTPALPA